MGGSQTKAIRIEFSLKKNLGLNDAQKQALIFVREAGAIDNQTYRQMADCDILKASAELRVLKNAELVDSKGRGKATYYIPGAKLIPLSKNLSAQPNVLSTQPAGVSTQPVSVITTHGSGLNTHGSNLNTHGLGLNTHGSDLNTHGLGLNTHGPNPEKRSLISEFPAELQAKIRQLKKREQEVEGLQSIILELCAFRPMKAEELAILFKKRVDYLRKKYLLPLLEQKKIRYLYPEMIKHPDQAYLTIK